jgi:hypothetical protein
MFNKMLLLKKGITRKKYRHKRDVVVLVSQTVFLKAEIICDFLPALSGARGHTIFQKLQAW